ncbi:hypothetical protein [Streptomyces sp. NPDC091259]|uniref:hypothetical protein n=1 Tax=Streptomyces sp. NPDC091259 TaxID=3365976 RepID=UPI003825E91D
MVAKRIVYPPDEQGWRRVRYDGVAIGVAHRPGDIRVFLAAAHGGLGEVGAPRPFAAPRLGSGITRPVAGAAALRDMAVRLSSPRPRVGPRSLVKACPADL